MGELVNFNMDPRNIKEFIKLMNRYETITLEEVKERWETSTIKMGHDVAQHLTGFGGSITCTLCFPISQVCEQCIYGKPNGLYGCLTEPHEKTYNDIDNADTPLKLRNAFRRRAKHMKKYYKHLFE